jgi:hypothetical protein
MKPTLERNTLAPEKEMAATMEAQNTNKHKNKGHQIFTWKTSPK